jgi:CheY-like chemotaxis protein
LPVRILVVDDDPLAGELIGEILRSAGMDASFLTSSAEASELLKREKYHADRGGSIPRALRQGLSHRWFL